MAARDTNGEQIMEALRVRETVTVATSVRNWIGLHDAHVYMTAQASPFSRHIGQAIHHALDLLMMEMDVSEDVHLDKICTAEISTRVFIPALVSLVQVAQAQRDGVIIPALGGQPQHDPMYTIPAARVGFQVLLEDQYPEIAAHLEALFR